MKEACIKLLKVKSIITIISLLGFIFLSVTRQITPQQYMEIFGVIIAFYFGTQSGKQAAANGDMSDE